MMMILTALLLCAVNVAWSQESACKDTQTSDRCNEWKREGHCLKSSPRYEPVTKRCMKTCEICSASEALTNLAVGKPASQSSTAHGGVASRAVDGNTNGHQGGHSCSYTGPSGGQWWRVDLQQTAKVIKVIIYNRQDCCSELLNNVQVTVGDSSDGKGASLCGKYGSAKDEQVLEIICSKPLHGRYVTVSTPTSMMTLCEVQVMGEASSASESERDDRLVLSNDEMNVVRALQYYNDLKEADAARVSRV